MKSNVYSIYDSAAKAFTTPFFLPTDGMAIRAFQGNVNSKEDNNISLHPDQFTLYKIGEWDDQRGHVEALDKIVSLGVGITFVENKVTDDQMQLFDTVNEKLDYMINLSLGD